MPEDESKVWSSWYAATLFVRSIASRGFSNKRVALVVRQQRWESCHGSPTQPPCSHRLYNDEKKYHYCDMCSCPAKREMSRLSDFNSPPENPTMPANNVYIKLDFPTLYCPIGRPGFTNEGTIKDDN